METNVKLQVRIIVREAHNVIKSADSDCKTVSTALKRISLFLPNRVNQNHENELPLPEGDMQKGRNEFMAVHYRQWLEVLVSLFTVDWIEKLPRGQVSVLLDVFFLQGTAAEAFTVLVNTISKNR